ncbi:MAG: hypothetical protein CVU11_13355 [Bacteroidetes bacterium HGW-Bacteroidetes-6]|jgi:hypothetical protein|nr:MAG: hypothetical protein CVU11_13355 [Bacteroidetes bacterium HGW-Bacteroidetes-6]
MKKVFLITVFLFSVIFIFAQNTVDKPILDSKELTKADTTKIQRPLQEAFASPTFIYAPPGTIIERTRIDTNVTESQLIRYKAPVAKKED